MPKKLAPYRVWHLPHGPDDVARGRPKSPSRPPVRRRRLQSPPGLASHHRAHPIPPLQGAHNSAYHPRALPWAISSGPVGAVANQDVPTPPHARHPPDTRPAVAAPTGPNAIAQGNALGFPSHTVDALKGRNDTPTKSARAPQAPAAPPPIRTDRGSAP